MSPPTTTLAMYSQIIRSEGGASIRIPDPTSLIVPKKIIEIDGSLKDHRTVRVPKRTPTSPQPAPTLLWKWKPGMVTFESILARIHGSTGFVYVTVVSDKPTSDTDLSPLGTHRQSMTEGLPCWGEFKRTTSATLVHPTLATAAGDDADDYPAILTDPASVPGLIYEVWARADSTEADVLLDLFVDG